MIVGLLFPLIIIGVIVWLAQHRKAGVGGEPGVVSLRRFLSYALLLAALFTAASGVALLLASVLPAGQIAGDRTSRLALGLSLTLVAVPVWALLWRMLARRLRAQETERAAPAWALYVVVAATVSLLVAFLHAVDVGCWLVGVEPYAPAAIANTVVWAGVWAVQLWVLRSAQLAPTGPLPQLATLAGSGVGLGALAVGTTDVIRYGLGRGYELLAGSAFVQTSATQTLRTGLVLAGLAVPVWWWHWVRDLGGPRTGPWHAYVMLVAVLGGLLTAVVSGGIALHRVLQWWLGDPATGLAATHFDVLPGALAAAVVGLSVWWYHRRVLAAQPLRRRSEPERAFGYLVAAVGLLATAAGITVAIMAGILAVVPPAFATPVSQANTLVLALTLLLVGTPVWWTFWRRLQTQVAGGEPVERGSVSRRVYLMLLIGGAGLTAMISLASVLFAFFRDLLDGRLAISVLRDVRTGLGLVVTAGAVAGYHWMVHRQDRAAVEPAPQTIHPRSVLLISADGVGLAAAIADATGAKVERLHRLDTAEHDVDVAGLTAAVLAAPYERVMVTVGEAGEVSVIPFERV